MLPRSIVQFDPSQKFKNRDLEISEFPHIDEVDGVYLASPRGLLCCKTEPPDYILMFCSANVPGITYKINFGDFCPPFKKKYLRVPPSSVNWASQTSLSIFLSGGM